MPACRTPRMSNGEESTPTMNDTTQSEPLRSGRLLADALRAIAIREAWYLAGELGKLSLLVLALFFVFSR